MNGLNSDVVFTFGLNSECSFTDFSQASDGIRPGLAIITTDCVIELIIINQVFIIKRCLEVHLYDLAQIQGAYISGWTILNPALESFRVKGWGDILVTYAQADPLGGELPQRIDCCDFQLEHADIGIGRCSAQDSVGIEAEPLREVHDASIAGNLLC